MRARVARPDDADDYAAFVRFSAQLGVGQPPPSRERWAAHLAPHTRYLVTDGGAIVAYALVFVHGARADVRQIVVDAAARRRGVGARLMAALRAELAAAGCTEWRLEVDDDNAAAIALYRRVGMRLHHAIEAVRIGAGAAAAFGGGRAGAVIAADADLPRLEAALEFGAGQLASWRAYRPHCPLLRVGERGVLHAWFDFAPDRGLGFVFRAADAEVAAQLLAALPPGPATWELCVSDPPVHAALLAAGATPAGRQLELAGVV